MTKEITLVTTNARKIASLKAVEMIWGKAERKFIQWLKKNDIYNSL